MWMQISINPYKNYWQGGASSSQDGAGRRHQTWEQQRWAARDWTKPAQEEPNEDDADQTEEEEVYDENGKLIMKEKR
eukprot:1997953-Heterocapsa_arctica.AAC.1